MELLKKMVSSKPKENKRAVKPYNARRVVTRKIMRNKLKFELKKLGYKKINKNFKYILLNMDLKDKLNLLNK